MAGERLEAKRKLKGGSFRTMGLDQCLLRALGRKGFANPTPIQRKSIPLLLEGRDVVAMARTGSGKTGAFAVPIVQRLRCHRPTTGVRALVLEPTRELAQQTARIVEQLATFTDLRVACIVGGDGLEEQFALLAANPDIVVATPGRLVHLCVEARTTLLSTVELLVFDEADRLFELGLAPQLSQLIDIMNDCGAANGNCAPSPVDVGTARIDFNKVGRQCALFSATLPQQVADFARLGLGNPEVVRLDADGSLSVDLRPIFLHCKSGGKIAALMHCLLHLPAVSGLTTPGPGPLQALVFVSTRHHAELLVEVAGRLFGLRTAPVHGTLDQEARVQALERFRGRTVDVLFVTDVAARGLDLPLLDVVINFDFPPRPKLFVHRVGRVARNGRPGVAISLVCLDELPFFLDLQLFVGDRRLDIGAVPQPLVDELGETIRKRAALTPGANVEDLQRVAANAAKLYTSTRPAASPESYARAKTLAIAMHPLFAGSVVSTDPSILGAISAYKRHQNLLNIPELKVKSREVPTAPGNPTTPGPRSFYLSYGSSKSRVLEKAYALEDSVLELKTDGSGPAGSRKKTTGRITGGDSKQTYDKWRKKSQLAVPRAGEAEDVACSQSILAKRKEKHQKTREYLSRRGRQRTHTKTRGRGRPNK